jgi:hypothetical protein
MNKKKKKIRTVNLFNKSKRTIKAGKQIADAIIELVHLTYLDDNAIEILAGLIHALQIEFVRRKELWLQEGNSIRITEMETEMSKDV